MKNGVQRHLIFVMLNTVLEDTKTCRQRKTFREEEHVKINIELDNALEETEVLIRAAK